MKAEILKGQTWEQYREMEGLNWSRLKVMAQSPAHYQWSLTSEDKDTEPKRVGRGAHTALLEPKLFGERYAIWSGGKRQGKVWDAFEATAKQRGQETLKAEQSDAIKELAFAARRNHEVSRLITGGKAELTIRWEVEVPSVGDLPGRKWVAKSRIDYLGPLGAVDLKTTKSAKPDKFARDAWDLGYLGQAAYYQDAVQAATGSLVPFHFLAIEKVAPYVVTPFVVPDELLEVGREHYRILLARLALCERTGVWPGYVEGVATLEAPPWVAQRMDEDAGGLGIEFEPEEEG